MKRNGWLASRVAKPWVLVQRPLRFFFEIFRLLSLVPVKFINVLQFKIAGIKTSQIKINGLLVLSNSGLFEIGSACKINSSQWRNVIGGDTRTSIVVHRNASLKIGKGVRISNSAIQCAESVTIGDYTMIGGSCKIWDTDFHSIDPIIRKNTPNAEALSAPIDIGENVFIGGFSIILKGVSIGENAVVAAGSVVSGNIPSNEIWGGNPAKFIRKI